MVTRGITTMRFHYNLETTNENAISNENYAMDTARTLQYTRFFLGILGVWPMVKFKPTKWEICASKFLIVTCFLLLAFLIIPCISYTFCIEKNPLVRLTMFGPIGFCLTNILKYCSIIFRRATIKDCMAHVEIDWMKIETKNDREIMIRNVNIGRHITVLCAIFMYTGGMSYHTVMPLWRGNEINEFNKTVRPLPNPGYDIFLDSNASPIYEIIFCTICTAACVMFTVTTSACNLAATFVAHVCGQIEIIISRFKTFFGEIDEKNEILERRIGTIIKLHVRMLRLTSLIEGLLREICLVEVVASVVIICLLEYYCLTTWNDSETVAIITYLGLLTSLTFNIFIFCHIGELLKGQCAQIGAVAYEMDWYRLPGKTGLALVMLMAMSNCPRRLTAGQMMELSVNSFGSIIKTSVAYLNMLRTMAD